MSPSERAGNIYDLGYRTYDGARLGRPYAIQSLFTYSLRSAFGLGRKTTSKIIPFLLASFVFVPGAIALGVAALVSEDVELWSHNGYYDAIAVVLALFAAAVSPEAVSRDQRTRTLALYFSRSLSRRDYAASNVLALVAAMLILTLGPQALLFFGRALATDSVPDYLSDNADDVLPIILSAAMLSTLIALIGVAIASYTARRAYATVGILAVFMLTWIFANILAEASGSTGAFLGSLVSPFHVTQGFTYWVFDGQLPQGEALEVAGVDGWVWGAVAVGYIVGLSAIILRRYERIAA
jgi:ABC-2 type transport system permease protein